MTVSARRTIVALMTLLLQIGAAGDTTAQRPSALLMEGSVGVGAAYSNSQYVPSVRGYAAEALVGARVVRALTVAVGLGLNADGSSGAVCRITPEGECGEFGHFTSLSLLAGWENSREWFRIRVGPAWVKRSIGGSALGIEVRADATGWLTSEFGLGVAARSTTVPEYLGGGIQMIAIGLGLRLRGPL